jgi:hypothetical protein
MAKKKLKIKKSKSGKSWREWFSWGSRNQKRSSRTELKETLTRRLKIAAMCIFLPLLPAAIVAGFFYMEKYVNAQQQAEPPTGPLVFVRGQTETVVPGSNYKLNKDTAKMIAEELSTKTWLYDIQVQTKREKVLVYAQYRLPTAFIKDAKGKVLYIGQPVAGDPLGGNENAVFVSDYTVDVPPMIEVAGFSDKDAPTVGKAWYAADVAAALTLLTKLTGYGETICPHKPLVNEIASIDVTNFNGRKVMLDSHITLILRDGTPVFWGAAYGQASRQLEAPEEEKLNKLYTFYQERKYTLMGQPKFIDLRMPLMGIPRPQ